MKNTMFKKIDELDKFFCKAEMAFSCCLLVLMVVTVGLGVFLRYVLKSPLVAGMNFATLMLVWVSFFGASAIYREKGHIAIEFILNRFPMGLRNCTLAFVYLIIAVSLFVTVITAIRLMTIQWGQEIVALGIPRSVLSLPLVIAGVLMLLTTVRHFIFETGLFSTQKDT